MEMICKHCGKEIKPSKWKPNGYYHIEGGWFRCDGSSHQPSIGPYATPLTKPDNFNLLYEKLQGR